MSQIWTDRHGHQFIREDRKASCISLDRLTAYAWGQISDVYEDCEIHHVNHVPWVTAEWNLQPLSKSEHAKITRQATLKGFDSA